MKIILNSLLIIVLFPTHNCFFEDVSHLFKIILIRHRNKPPLGSLLGVLSCTNCLKSKISENSSSDLLMNTLQGMWKLLLQNCVSAFSF